MLPVWKKGSPLLPWFNSHAVTTRHTWSQRSSVRKQNWGEWGQGGTKISFFRFLQHPRADHCSLTAILPQKGKFSNHQPVMCPVSNSGHPFSFFPACLWPAVGWFGVSTWLQGLFSCLDSMVGSQETSEREWGGNGRLEDVGYLHVCSTAPGETTV